MSENDKKREIRQKALSLFRQKGYDNVTVNEIAKAAGISKNTFYYYYDSKEDLIRDVFRPSGYSGEKLAVELMKIADPWEQILKFCSMSAQHFEGLGKEVVRKAMIMNLASSFVEGDRSRPHPNEWTREMISAIYQRAIEQNRIRADLSVKEIMKLQMTLLIGCLQCWATMSSDIELEQTYLRMVHEVLRPAGH